jgi:tRNA-Thr(GGU) m(6)t(6)A37 methyltransferase TsaA
VKGKGSLKLEFVVKPIGVVKSPRVEIQDDFWGGVVSVIELDPEQFQDDVTAGLADFSHLDVVYCFHKVDPAKIEMKARHPRNRQDWPLVGIFAQRAKGRPNRLAVSTVRLLKVEGLKLTVQALDAIDGTPVLDIKPYMAEFGPKGEVRQPQWSRELMEDYFKE